MSLQNELNQSSETESDDEYLVRCVVDTSSRKFNLYSSEGTEKVIECETVDQFMNVLQVVRALLTSENIAELAYSEPLVV